MAHYQELPSGDPICVSLRQVFTAKGIPGGTRIFFSLAPVQSVDVSNSFAEVEKDIRAVEQGAP